MKGKGLMAALFCLSANAFAAAYPVLNGADPARAGFNVQKLTEMDARINEQIAAGYPGLNLLVVKDAKVVWQKAYGYAKKYDGSTLMPTPVRATTNTMYDLASNTKMYATNFALQKLVFEKKLNVNDLISAHIPGFADRPGDRITGKNRLRIADLLHHTGGFPADPQYPNQRVARDLFSQDKATTLEMIKRTPLSYPPGTQHVYSDVDYMLLGFIIESVTGMPLDKYVETQIFQPLGVTRTVFNPLKKGFSRQRIAATELNGNTRDGAITFPGIRTKTIWGEVHDEKAWYSMGGVSGHAGLFSTTHDIAVLMQTMLNGGGYGSVQVFDRATVEDFTRSSKEDATYGLGWRVNGNASMQGIFGHHASAQTYGHTGWTGTLTLIDPVNQLAIVILGNRPHSPVADKTNPNVFESGRLPISTYGWVVDQVYEALEK
nr:penicillin binding protein PBP4B [uncultured Enterobacter sp.]